MIGSKKKIVFKTVYAKQNVLELAVYEAFMLTLHTAIYPLHSSMCCNISYWAQYQRVA
jgi:hypothetical protein